MRSVLLNSYRFVFTALSILLFSFSSKAQIEPILVGTTTRNMLVYAPSGITPGRPLLLSLHGLNQDIAYQKNQTKWETVAQANNFVVVYPAGINNSWDLYGTTDTDFILAIIDEMYNRYGIDRKRVYLSGFSMGGMMTYHAANVIADKIAAFAPVSGYLMGGPDTNSTRPIPIIHTHGTGDDVVPFSGVQTCLDAWISRNNCPTAVQITDPYPPDKPSSNGEKHFWGPGTDNVQVVLLKLNGPGHWHSIDPNGVNTTQEIWDFCKNFSLGFGVPEFGFAYVGDSDPMRINLLLNESIKSSDTFEGFIVKVDSQIVMVDSLVLADTNQLSIYLQDSILKENVISLSYTGGNVASIYNKPLENFSDTLVENLLKGAAPRVLEFTTGIDGDTLMAKFNKKMQIPADISALTLRGEYNGDISVPLSECSFANSDSTLLVFTLAEQVYADYELFVSYSGNNIASSDSGLLKTFTDFPVTNNSVGLTVHLDSAVVGADSYTLTLGFPKRMTLEDDQREQFIFERNGQNLAFHEYSVSGNFIRFILADNLHYDDEATISYTPGNITAFDRGALEGFSNFTVDNLVTEPNWQEIPGRIEAENYAYQFGTSTENTSDAGGGLNVGWIETGDWLEYAIVNNNPDTDYQVTFRVASTNSGRKINFYLDDEKIQEIIVPNTGNWQVWTSVSFNVSIGPGQHYVKVVAASDGFNINYFEINTPSSVRQINDEQLIVGPNPVADKIQIFSGGFQYHTIEILDTKGRTVLRERVEYRPEFHMQVNLPDGVYYLKFINHEQFQLKKITVLN